jgi:hypothetical protein
MAGLLKERAHGMFGFFVLLVLIFIKRSREYIMREYKEKTNRFNLPFFQQAVFGVYSLFILCMIAGFIMSAGAVSVAYGDDNYEENDTLATAWHPGYSWEQTWLEGIDGLGVQADDDWYRIDVGPSGFEHVQVDVLFTHADGDINVCLFNGSGVQLACSDDVIDNEFIDHVVPGPGTYYIRVFGQDAGNTYNLRWNNIQGDDNYEGNDTLATAYYPGINWEQVWLSGIGGLGIQADDDWYRINVTPGFEHVQVDVRFTDADGDINVCLVNGSGVELACSTSATDNEFIDYEVPGPGIYYIRVFGQDAGNEYDLWWDDRQEDDAYEENDTLATAWHPGTNWENTWLSSIDGLGVQADDDWYRIDVASERVQIDVQFIHADGDIDVCLVDESEVPLACSESVTDNEFIDTEVPGPGTYYILVYFDDAGNTYDLWWDDLCLMSLSDVSYAVKNDKQGANGNFNHQGDLWR